MKKFIPVILFCSFLNADFIESKDIVLYGHKGSDKTPTIYDCKNSVDCIYFEGEITKGDYKKFEKSLVTKLKRYYLDVYEKTSENLKYFYNNASTYDSSNYKTTGLFQVFINSTGGNVQEAIQIAKLLRDFEIAISVPMDGVCYSACFYLFSAGIVRLADRNTIGIHSPSFEKKVFSELSQSEADFLYKGMEAEAYNLLRDFNIPEKFISKMKSVSSDDLYTLKTEELNELVTDRVYKERMLTMGQSLHSAHDQGPAELLQYAETVRFFVLRNLSSKFPQLIEDESLGVILTGTTYLDAFSFQHAAGYFEFGDKRPHEERAIDAMKKFSEADPEKFLFFTSVIEGLRDTSWYEALLKMNKLRLYSDEMIQEILNKNSYSGELGDSFSDIKTNLLTLLLLDTIDIKPL